MLKLLNLKEINVRRINKKMTNENENEVESEIEEDEVNENDDDDSDDKNVGKDVNWW